MFCLGIELLCHPISRPTNFNCFADVNFALIRLGEWSGILGFTGGSLCQIGLVALPLSVGQIVSFIVVQCQTQLTLITAEVIPHKIGILGKVDGLEGEPAEALSAVDSLVLGGGSASAARL